MFIGSQLHANATSWGKVAETVRCMDDGPWHSAWVPDHFVPPLDFLNEADDNFEGWTLLTALSLLIFVVLHHPCSTTLLTIKHETGSWGWTAAAFVIPLGTGLAVLAAFASVWRLVGGG